MVPWQCLWNVVPTEEWWWPECVELCFQGYQDVRDRMIHRSTSQGSINSPVYSRHSYTPTTSRSPQHFHRPGKGDCSWDSLCNKLYFCDFFPLLFSTLKNRWLNISIPLPEQNENWYPTIFYAVPFLETSVILWLCTFWFINYILTVSYWKQGFLKKN